MALGAFLFEHKMMFPNSWKIWSQQNTDYKGLLDLAKKFAYRPFQNYQSNKEMKANSIRAPLPGETDNDFMDPRVLFF